MSTASQIKHMEEDIREKVGALETDVSGMKRDVSNLSAAVADYGREMKENFRLVFERMENKGWAAWQLILSGFGVAVTLAVGMALWANAYFGQSIAAVQRDADRAIELQSLVMQQVEKLRDLHTAEAVQSAILTERSERNRYEIDRLREDKHP